MWLIAVVLGNTRARLAQFHVAPDGYRLARYRTLSHADIASRKHYSKSETVVYASVNPGAERAFVKAVKDARGEAPLRLGRDFQPAIRNRYKPPTAAGADRLANAAAAWFVARKACVVVDLGTAITFSVVSGKGEFLGGLIAPGLATQARALNEHTALLPEITPVRARRAIGRGTRESIEAGIGLGVEGLIVNGLERARRELGAVPRVIGTGGDASLFADLFDEVRPELTAAGVAVSYAFST